MIWISDSDAKSEGLMERFGCDGDDDDDDDEDDEAG